MKLLSSILFSAILIIGVGFIAPQAHAQVANGCTSTTGYSSTTGVSCNGFTTIPMGCNSTAGFSSSTGQPCNGNTATVNGYNGSTVGTNGYLNGCASTAGYSSTTGYPCNMAVNGVIYNGPAGTINTGTGVVTTAPTTDPGLPTTGSTDAAATIVLLAVAAATAIGATWYAAHQQHAA